MKPIFTKLSCAGLFFFLTVWAAHAASEQDLLAVLKSSADIPDKCQACKELRIVGSANAVPALAACLPQDRLSQAARYALEGMACSEATQALRDALNQTAGANKAGIIDSLGWKRDSSSISPLTALLADADPMIVSAAAISLGRIGGKQAIAALAAARGRVSPTVNIIVMEALLACADGLRAGGDAKGAAAVYSSLNTADLPQSIRLAAWRGMVLNDPKHRVSHVLQALQGSDPALRLTALKVLREAQDRKLVVAGLGAWSSLDSEAQLAVLDASTNFGKERDKALALAVGSASPLVRQAAWMALVETGEIAPAQLKAMALAATQAQPPEQEAARQALAQVHGNRVWDNLKDLVEKDPGLRPELLRAFGERRDVGADTVLLKYARDTGPSRSAALEGLRKLASLETLTPLLALAASSDAEGAQQVLEVINAVCQANLENNQVATQVMGAWKGYNEVQRRRALPLLAELGTTEALEAALEATRGSDIELRKTAVRTLAEWPSAAPGPALLDLAKSASEPVVQTLAVRGAIKVASHEKDSTRRLALLSSAITLSRLEEKRSALAGMGQIPTAEALSAVLSHLKDPDLVDETAQAAVSIAEKVAQTNPKLAAETAEAVLAASKTPEVVKRAWGLRGKPVASGAFIQDWLVCGPFAKDGIVGADGIFNVPLGPETGGAVEWRTMPQSEICDLNSIFPERANCAAYLKAQLVSPAAIDAMLLVGSDDGVKAWLNGKVVHVNNVDRGYVADQDTAPVHLHPGTNDLLLKITQGGGGWVAAARVVGADGAPVPGLRVERQSAPTVKALKVQKTAPEVVVPSILPQKGTYKKLRLSDQFYAEGAFYADFNRDGKLDIVAGPFWFEGPNFQTRHEYREVKTFEAAKEYSDNFLTYADDLNQDGWPDILFVPFPGKEGFWYENPRGKEAPWARHLAYDNIGNESPMWGDVIGAGSSQLLFCNEGFLGYASPNRANPTNPWAFHAISTENKRYQKFTHGIGFGDINGDKRNDVVEAAGWWEQPAQRVDGQPWIWHPFRFSEAAAQMHIYDVNGDGLSDVITSWHCHLYGLVWWQQIRAADGKVDWKQHTILPATPNLASSEFRVSQLHAMVLADMNGDGLLDILTGKRFWAHGPTGDKEPDAPAVVFWFELRREGPEGATFVPHLIDDNSGVGTQVAAADLNGDQKLDVVVANKKGIFVHLNQEK